MTDDQVSPSDPFAIEGPAVISFSGGRTSGYMFRPSYHAMLAQPDLFNQPDESLTECYCHD